MADKIHVHLGTSIHLVLGTSQPCLFKALVVSGSMNNDYGVLFSGKTTKLDNYTATGISNAILASRVSYVFNLQGPCMVLDTACSASLVAIHQGCLAIYSGELLGVESSLIAVQQGCLAIYSGELLDVERSRIAVHRGCLAIGRSESLGVEWSLIAVHRGCLISDSS